MPIIISNISTPIESTKEEIINIALKKLELAAGDIRSASVTKTSVDARRGEIKFISSVAVFLNGDEDQLVKTLGDKNVNYRPINRLELVKGSEPLETRPVIVGFGPAGMFAALTLARNGYRPIVIERGGDVDSRVKAVEGFWQGGKLDTTSNVQYGEGGAGTFSDGKLTTRIGDSKCEFVLDEFVKHGANEDLLVKAKPHIGTDKLRGIVKSIRKEICDLGGEVHFETMLQGIKSSPKGISGITTNSGNIDSQVVILAVGHSARDTFQLLADASIPMESKAFSVGVRIEHLQQDIDKGLYGRFAGHPNLPVGEYQLSHREGERAAYTFCMCPGGTVVAAASEEGGVVTNGMSAYARSMPNANSALAVSVGPEDFGAGWQDGINFQRNLEKAAFVAAGKNYRAPAQTVGSFLGKGSFPIGGRLQPTYQLGVEEVNLSSILPAQVSSLIAKALPIFGRKLPGFDRADSILTGVETRTSSPVRVVRGENLCSLGMNGLYPCGEGAGYAGGIMSAAVDGIKIAEAIISKYSPLLP